MLFAFNITLRALGSATIYNASREPFFKLVSCEHYLSLSSSGTFTRDTQKKKDMRRSGPGSCV